MPKPYRRKFERSKEADPLKLQPRDVALLRNVWEFRFLNTEQIVALHEGSPRGIANRLGGLFRLGYLDRPEVQKTARLTTSHTVYSLGRKGVEVLSKNAEERAGIFRHVQEVKKTSALISHSLMISQFRVCLMLALKGTNTKLVRWVQGNDLKILLRRHGENPELVPDAFFTLEDKGDLLHFFLEADRATETQERFVSKLRIYWKWWGEKRCEASLGITRFRVLTITPNETRSDNLCKASKDADPRKQGSAMFLFASETKFSIALPDEILRTVWKCPKDETLRSIIE